ncbi:unnamed protein product [Caretta caretta]
MFVSRVEKIQKPSAPGIEVRAGELQAPLPDHLPSSTYLMLQFTWSMASMGLLVAPGMGQGEKASMTSLLQDKLQEIHSQAPSPSKDFHHFTITKPEVIWRSWRISFQPNQEKIFPKERQPIQELCTSYVPTFSATPGLTEWAYHSIDTEQVQNIFGNKMLEYTLNLCQGCYDFLARMPDNLILHILSFLNTDDIRQLSKTCKKFQQLCSREELWERVRRLQDKHTNELKIMRVPVYKKLTYFNQKPSQRRCREDRPHSFKCDWQLSD